MKRLLGFVLAVASGAAAAADAGNAANIYTPGGDNDPRVRSAQYLAGNNRFLSAAALLREVQAEAPQKRFAPPYYRDLAADTLSFGLPQRAEVIYREQIADAKDPLSLAQARLRLADFYYQRAYYQQASTELSTVRQQLPPELLINWQDLQSRVLLAQGRYGEAADILTQADSSGMTDFMRYNLAVALINDGRVGQGVNMLDRVGRLTPTDSDSLALRDKANLTLGYHFLKTQQGGTAVPIFGRVRTEGPYSNKALLGLGWAYLAPRGTKQKKAELGDETPPDQTAFTSFATIGVLLRPGYIDSDSIYKRAKMTPFHLNGRSADEEAQLRQALVPWVELTSRDSIDPAVQEGLLAIPYVLDRLGAHIQAQQYYERAIASLEETRTRLDSAEEHVRSGRMVKTMIDHDPTAESGWMWKLKSLPDAPETFYLQTLLAENSFQEALKNFRDTRLLQSHLEIWKKRLGDLQHTYQTRNGQEQDQDRPDLTPTPLQASNARAAAVEAGETPDAAAAKQLQLANHLTAYNGQGSPDGPDSEAPVPLQLAKSPGAEQFVGPFEHMQVLRTRIDALLPQLAAAEQAQGTLLQNIALDDLEKQKTVNEKLLTESRFALARIYDSELKGPNTGDSK